MKPSYVLIAVLSAVSGSSGAATFPNIDFGRALNVFKDTGTALTGIPEKEEIALGRELAGRTMGAAPLVKDATLQKYVNQVGRSVAAHSDRPELPWRFGVIDTASLNAFAAPGGVILVTRGLYEALDNEAQLAAVLGHEIAHVMKRHHVDVMRKQAGTQALAGAGQTYLQATGRDRTGIADKVLGTGAEIFTKQLDQGAEYEADSVGLQLAIKAGYSAAGMIDVLQKLHAHAGEPSTNLLFETHPHPSERLTKIADVLEPQMATLPAGSEPPLQVAASSLPPPVATTGGGRPNSGTRSMTSENAAPQQSTGGATTSGSGLTSGSRRGRAGGGLPGAAEGLLRGILGR